MCLRQGENGAQTKVRYNSARDQLNNYIDLRIGVLQGDPSAPYLYCEGTRIHCEGSSI
jgi:hypothetical protein